MWSKVGSLVENPLRIGVHDPEYSIWAPCFLKLLFFIAGFLSEKREVSSRLGKPQGLNHLEVHGT